MKHVLVFSILLSMSLACHKDTSVGPANLLFQRWHKFRSKLIGDESWMFHDLLFFYDTEYRPDGTLVYRKDEVIQAVQCCRGNQFRRDGLERVGEFYSVLSLYSL